MLLETADPRPAGKALQETGVPDPPAAPISPLRSYPLLEDRI